MLYVIRRTDQGGGWVSQSGSKCSYTLALQTARVWQTREAAERQRCPGNEVVESVEQVLADHRR